LASGYVGHVLEQTLPWSRRGKRVLVVYNPVAEKVSDPGGARYNVYVG